MKQALLGILLSIFWATNSHAAFNHPATSPTVAACGETFADRSFSAGMTLNNPAAVCLMDRFSAEFSGQRLYALSELDSYLAAGAIRRGKWGLAGSFQSLGESDFYLETTFMPCIGYNIAHNLYIGGSIAYNRIEMGESYGNLSSLSFGCGVIFIPASDWMTYASLKNPHEPEITEGSMIHRELDAGITVTRFDDVDFAVGVSARSGDDVRYKIGETYRLSSSLSVSAGIMTSPFAPSFGCRFSLDSFDLLYAYRYHPELGGTHLWGIAFSR